MFSLSCDLGFYTTVASSLSDVFVVVVVVVFCFFYLTFNSYNTEYKNSNKSRKCVFQLINDLCACWLNHFLLSTRLML